MNKRRTVELSMKELLIVLLRKWWVLVICAVVVGGVYGINSYFSRRNSLDELQRRYDVDMTAYNQDIRSKENVIRYLSEKVKATEAYNNDSILMQIDPFNMNVAHLTAVVSLSTTDTSTRSAAAESQQASIAAVYASLVDGAPIDQLFETDVLNRYPEFYLRELISAELPKESNKNVLSLSVTGYDGIDPLKVVNKLFSYLKSRQNSLSALSVPHDLASLEAYAVSESNDELAKQLSEKRESLAQDTAEIKKLEESIGKIRQNKPVMPSLLRGSLKSALIAGIVAIIVMAFVIVINYIALIPIQTDEQIQSQLGIRYLKGGLFKKSSFIGRWGDRLSGVDALASDQKVKDIVHANIREATHGKYNTVLVTGTMDQRVMEILAGELQQAVGNGTTFIAAGDVSNSAAAVEALESSDAVLLAERIGGSRLKRVSRVVERVQQSNKDIIGYTLL